MEIKLVREEFGEKSTIGKLYIDDIYFCDTLEDKVREVKGKSVSEWKIPKVTAIPTGTYQLILSMSNRFGKILPEVLRVPGYSGVRIHSGNKSEDTEGCIILGKRQNSDWVGDSKNTTELFIYKLTLTLKNSPFVTFSIS